MSFIQIAPCEPCEVVIVGPITIEGIDFALEKGESANVTSVAASVSSVPILVTNTARHSFHIFNDSTSSLFVKFGLAASLTSFTIKIISNGYQEFIYPPYIGVVTGVWQADDGFARVTEVII